MNEDILKLKKRKQELEKAAEFTKQSKKKIIEIAQKLAVRLGSKQITRGEYEEELKKALKNRTAEQWIKYYDDYLDYYNYQAKLCDTLIKQEKYNGTKETIRKKAAPALKISIVIAVIALIFTLIFILKPAGIGVFEKIGEKVSVSIKSLTEKVPAPEEKPEIIKAPESKKEISQVFEEPKISVLLEDKDIFIKEESLIQYQAILGKNVRWKKQFKINGTTGFIVELPKNSENIKVKAIEEGEEKDITEIADIKKKRSFFIFENGIEIKIKAQEVAGIIGDAFGGQNANEQEFEITYETPAPEISALEIPGLGAEGRIIKKIIIKGPDDVHYKDVLSFTELPREFNKNKIGKLKLYEIKNSERIETKFIAYDTDENGLYDYIEWLTPELSEAVFELVIEISKAEHLDENRIFISDIYDEVYQLDGNWSEEINGEEYVRVTFEQPLDNTRDITIYLMVISGEPRIEVYESDGSEIIAEITNLISNEYNKVFLTNLIGEQDVFDLRVVGGSVEIEHIIDPDISACGLLSIANSVYNLTQNVTSTGTCFNVTANNVTLNCNGYEINYSSNGGNYEYGVYSNKNFTTIKNCVIKEGLAAGDADYAVYFNNAKNGTIQNNTITTSGSIGFGVYLHSSSNFNTVSNNTITALGSGGDGIFLESNSKFNTLSSNTIITDGDGGFGIHLYSNSDSNTVSNNTIITSGEAGFGIYSLVSSNNKLLNNTITTSGVAYGIWLHSTNLTSVSNNIISTFENWSYGISLFLSSSNTLSNNRITTFRLGSYGIFLSSGSDSNTFLRNTITTSGSNGYGIYFLDSSTNNSFSEINVKTNNTGSAIFIEDINHNFTIRDSILNSSSAGVKEFFINASVKGGTWNFINVTRANSSQSITINWTLGGNGTLNMKWYLDVNVTNSSGSALQNANVSAWNKNNIFQFSANTTASGLIPRQTLLEYTNINNTLKTYFSNYTVNTTKTGYPNNSQSVNMSGNILLNVVLSESEDLTCGNLNITNKIYTLTQNVSSTGTCFNVTANNVTLNCNGYEINYSSNGGNYEYGVYSNQNFTTIKNCRIKEGAVAGISDYGIYFDNAKNGTINNNTITTLELFGDGIRLDSSSSSSILSNTILTSGGFGNGIYLIMSSNFNTISNNTITTLAGGYNDGIYLATSSRYNIISSNKINTISQNSFGIYLVSSSNYNRVLDNRVITSGIEGHGIYSRLSSDGIFSNNTVIASGVDGYDVYLYSSSNNMFSNNTLTTSGSKGYGIYLSTNANNNSFSGMNVKTNGPTAYAFYLNDTDPDFAITDSILNSSRAGIQEFYVASAVKGGTWNFINVTRANGSPINIFWTAGANGTLNMKWYLDVNVTNSTGALQDANVTAWNKNNFFQFSANTTASGLIPRQTLLEYTNINNTLKTYFSNYTVNTTKTGYPNNSQSVNMSGNILLNVVLKLNSAPIINSWTVNSGSPTSCAITPINFANNNFRVSVSDANGWEDMQTGGSVNVYFEKSGVYRPSTAPSVPASCSYSGNNGGDIAYYACLINMNYYDGAGSWTVYVIATDGELSATPRSSTGSGSYPYFNYLSSLILRYREEPIIGISDDTISWDQILTTSADEPADNHLKVENCGNAGFTSVSITGQDLTGTGGNTNTIEPDSFYADETSSPCSVGQQLNNPPSGKIITNTALAKGMGAGIPSENIYFCLKDINPVSGPSPVKVDAYSSSSAWDITVNGFIISLIKFIRFNFEFSILLSLVALRTKKKRKSKRILETFEKKLRKETRLDLGRLLTLCEILKAEHKIGIDCVLKIAKQERNRKLGIPVSIFKQNIGPSEALCKYLKENKGLKFNEIAGLLGRDERTIWSNYHDAVEKKREKIAFKDEFFIPIEIFSNRKLSLLESVVKYLKEKGFRNYEIAELLGKDQRNIYTLYSRANKKLNL